MLAEVLLKREPRSVSDISSPAVIAPTIMVAAVILRRARASFLPGVISMILGGAGGAGFYHFIQSIEETPGAGPVSNVHLVGDEGTPGNSKYYGTDDAGAKGYHDLPSGSGTIVRNFAFGLKRSGGIAIGKLAGYWTCPFAGTITAWNLASKLLPDAIEPTMTVKIWKAAGVAPFAADSINTDGISLDVGETYKHSTDLDEFLTTAVAVGDVFACEITAVTGVEDFGGSIEITQA